VYGAQFQNWSGYYNVTVQIGTRILTEGCKGKVKENVDLYSVLLWTQL